MALGAIARSFAQRIRSRAQLHLLPQSMEVATEYLICSSSTPVTIWRTVLFMVLVCMFTSQPVLSQESLNMECGTTESVEPPADLEIPLVGRFKALVIYVQFLDDDYDNSCTRGWTEWPSGTPLPAAASYILSSSHTPPFPDSSLTAFFYEQSNENFTIYGDVVGYTTAYEECHYVRVNDICYDDDTGEWGRLDYGRVAEEAFDSLHARGSVDFSNYDENNDGYLDHAFIVLRHNNLNF